MSNEIIFSTQLISIIVFIFSLFSIYRSLVANKDSIIQLLKERIEAQSELIKNLESQAPDVLAEALSKRIKLQLEEIERMKNDGSSHQEEIKIKESEINETQTRLSSLLEFIKDSDLICSECGAPLVRREFYSVFGYSGGREVEADCEYVEYECGLSINHDGESSPCRNRKL